ncbi:MAG: hypothetical protein AAF449_04105 [Myxococcota bacterium]
MYSKLTFALMIAVGAAGGDAIAQSAPGTTVTESPKLPVQPAARSPLFKRTKFDQRLEAMRGKIKLQAKTGGLQVSPNAKLKTRPLARARARQKIRHTDAATYQQQHREMIRALLKTTFAGRPLNAAAGKALQNSAQTNAKFDRIEDMATQKGDEASIERIERLRQAERLQLTRALTAAAAENQP